MILLVLRRFETEEISYWQLGSFVSWTCIRVVGEGKGPLKLHEPFLGDCNWEVQMWENDHRRKKFFINNSVGALIPFKEKHQGLLKLHVPLGWRRGFEYWGKWDYLQKRELSLKRKSNMWGGLLESIEILFNFWRLFREF